MAESFGGHIERLLQGAAQAAANGRMAEADALFAKAEAEAPQHPLVLNEQAARHLFEGRPEAARGLLETAVKADPGRAHIWLNLASACRALGLPAEEEAAVERVLKLDPRNLRALLQMGTIQERKGDRRAAAAVYRTALQSVPRGVDLPPEMRAHLMDARRLVEANNLDLERFLDSRLQDLRGRYGNRSLRRLDQCMAILLQKQPIYRQQPTFMYFPGVPAIEFYDRAAFPWLDGIEAAAEDIRAEFLTVFAEDAGRLEPYVQGMGASDVWRDLNESRRWSVYYLWKAGVLQAENLRRCPKTAKALEAWPQCELPGSGPSAVFSILDAKTRIPPHTGVNNARLICHLPLVVPPGCWFRVGSETREWEFGKAFVFDDTIEHEAWNGSDEPRAVLIFDIWNPYVDEAEREMVAALTEGVGAFYGSLPSYV
jgi:aspartyl/asparaginyl beta-hydroxylase (cupin superfamily)/Tfp pilus assembly protein PilF